ncbi:MAG: response regulator [Acidobacteria bacterium]|nr:response regulator [Acidobacteriota bacterium]
MSLHEPLNILMVDDQPAKLLSYETILKDLNVNLIRANSGDEALETLLRHEIAVILVDVCMPGLDGFELASMIRRHPRFQRTAIILVSGVFVEDVDRLKGYDSGAVDYVSVPIIPEILRAKVSVFLDLYRKTTELERLNRELERRVAERTAEIESAADKLRQNEERLRLVLTGRGIQAWTWDISKNEITWITPSGDSVCGFRCFTEFLSAVHPDDRAMVQEAFDTAVMGIGDYNVEYRMIDGNGEQWWQGRGTIIRDEAGRPLSIAGINTNITNRKRAEQERAILLKNAEEARREAEKANQLKDQFLATLSHELRSPLSAITGWAHMLRSGMLDEAKQAKALDIIHRNAMVQTQLISDILDVSRISSGKLHLELKPVDFPALVKAALDDVRPSAEAKNIQIDAVVPNDIECTYGDPARLQQVIWNLLSNAVKFAPDNGHVQVSLQKIGSKLELTVQDDGSGILPEFLPHVFEPFRQADSSSTRAHQGLGLGLAIVQHLLQMHGGSIEAMNRTDRSGALFKATIPMYMPEQLIGNGSDEQNDLPVITGSPAEFKGTRILIVDDHADVREIVSILLERSGAEVTLAASASEALKLIKRHSPDIVIADIEMPGEDGYSLIRKIRSLAPSKGGQTLAIALSAYASSQDRTRALEAGFQLHLAKPIQPQELITSVVSLLHRHRPILLSSTR